MVNAAASAAATRLDLNFIYPSPAETKLFAVLLRQRRGRPFGTACFNCLLRACIFVMPVPSVKSPREKTRPRAPSCKIAPRADRIDPRQRDDPNTDGYNP